VKRKVKEPEVSNNERNNVDNQQMKARHHPILTLIYSNKQICGVVSGCGDLGTALFSRARAATTAHYKYSKCCDLDISLL